jgi:hypothetical protein
MTSVSVVLATCNGERFLREQLRSLAIQQKLPDELIVSDDASTDSTGDIIEEFQRTAPFPVLFRRNPERLGYGENFLQAAALAGGDYIAFCDQDDVWHPDKLRIAVELLTGTGALLLVHTARVVDASGEPRGRFTQGITGQRLHSPLTLAPWGVFYGCTMVFPRRLLSLVPVEQRGPHTFEYDRLLSHDLWISFLAGSFGNVLTDDRPLIDYRQHGGNATPTILAGGPRAWIRGLGPAPDAVLDRAGTARHRAALARRVGASSAGLGPAGERAARYWDRIGSIEQRRAAVHDSAGWWRRASRCTGLVVAGGYRSPRRGGLGARLLAKDVLVGVLGAKTGARRVRRGLQRLRSGRVGR